MCFRPPSVSKPKRCPDCNSLNPGTLTVCRKCGAALPEPEPVKVLCPRCGAENLESDTVCKECGLTAGEAMVMMRNKGK